jgi:DNA-binding CsgD family transcriptional regulator
MFSLSPDLRADTARQALELREVGADTRGWLAGVLFHSLVVGGRTDEARLMAARLREIANAGTGREGRFTFELAHAGLTYQLLRLESAVREAEDAARTGTEHDGNLRILRYFQCWALVGADRFEEASEVLEDSISDARRDHQSWALRIFESWKGVVRAQTGRLPDAAAMLEGKFSPSDARLVVGVIDAVGLAGLGRVRIYLGDERGAREVADMCRVVMDASAPGPRRHAAWYLASYAMASGHHLEAHRWLQALGETERLSIFPLFPHDVGDKPELVRIAIAAGDDELVAQALHIAACRERLNPGLRSAAAIAAHVRGLATRGAADLEQAVDQLRSVSRPLALASALEDLGRVLAADGATDEGIKALSEALGIDLAIGASWDAARVRGRLRQLGVRRRIVSRAGPRTGWAALTPAELQVARLVTQGKTNRETADQLFVSPHTVNAHLRRIFEKTGVRSRVELTRAAANPASALRRVQGHPFPEHPLRIGVDRVRAVAAPCQYLDVLVVMWIAILVVLTCVVAVAMGRGGQLSEESPDYAPLDMGPVTATDIVLLRPPTALWGYNVQVTDEALERIAVAIRERDVRIVALEQRIADLTGGPASERHAPAPSPARHARPPAPQPPAAAPEPAPPAALAPESLAESEPPVPAAASAPEPAAEPAPAEPSVAAAEPDDPTEEHGD